MNLRAKFFKFRSKNTGNFIIAKIANRNIASCLELQYDVKSHIMTQTVQLAIKSAHIN